MCVRVRVEGFSEQRDVGEEGEKAKGCGRKEKEGASEMMRGPLFTAFLLPALTMFPW